MASPGGTLFELASKLTDPNVELEAKIKAADSIKDSIEITHTPEYPAFLQGFFGPLVSVLSSTQPQWDDSEQHKLRHKALEILSRLPITDALKPYAAALCDTMLHIVQTDNQANGVLALKCFVDLLRAFRQEAFEPQYASFQDFVVKAYSEFPDTLRVALDPDNPKPPTDFSPTHRSFKILADCPIPSVMYLMQVYPNVSKDKVPILLQPMVTAASQQIPAHIPHPPPAELAACITDIKTAQVHTLNYLTILMRANNSYSKMLEPYAPTVIHGLFYAFRTAPDAILIRKELIHATRYVISGPNKAAAFANYIEDVLDESTLMGHGLAAMDNLRPLALMTLCEILHHVRKIMSLEQLAKVVHLMGTYVVDRSLPFAAQSTCIRLLLNLVECLYQCFKRGESGLNAKIQAQAVLSKILGIFVAKLDILQGEIPRLMEAASAEKAKREERLRQLRTDAARAPEQSAPASDAAAGALGQPANAAAVATTAAEAAAGPSAAVAGNAPAAPAAEVTKGDNAAAGGATTAAAVTASAADGTGDSSAPAAGHMLLHLQGAGEKEKEMADCKLIVQNVIYGMKTLLFSILYCTRIVHALQQQVAQGGAVPPVALPAPPPAAVGMHEADVRTCAKLLSHGLHCLKVNAFFSEGKDFCEHFAEIFTVLDPRDFVDVFSVQMGVLFGVMVSDGDALTVAAHLVQSATVGKVFNSLLAGYLVEHKLGALAEHNSKEAMLVQKLFRLVFVGLTLPEGEILLVPSLVKMLDGCLQAAVKERAPLGYLTLLRMFFKSCQGSREPLKMLYAECTSRLAPCLTTLLAMLDGPNSGEFKPLLVELCLMLPAQLSSLLPLLPKLMRPLVMALKGNDELVVLGLKTLECWVDSLNPEFLEPAMADVVHEVIPALWALLKPGHYNMTSQKSPAMMAMALLGKLGGRNRKFLKEPIALDYKDNPEHGLRLILTFQPHTSFLVPIDRCVSLAKAGIFGGAATTAAAALAGVAGNVDKEGPFYKEQALKFLHVCLASVLNLRSPDELRQQGDAADQLASMLLAPPVAPNVRPVPARQELGGVKTKTQLVAERQVLTTLVTAVIGACGDEALAPTALPFCRGICRHFAMLFAAGARAPPPAPIMSRPHVADGTAALGFLPQGLCELDVHLFLDAIIEILCDSVPSRARAAVDALSVFVTTIMQLHAAQTEFKARRQQGDGTQQEEAAAADGEAGNDGDGDAGSSGLNGMGTGLSRSQSFARSGSITRSESPNMPDAAAGAADASNAANGTMSREGSAGGAAEASTSAPAAADAAGPSRAGSGAAAGASSSSGGGSSNSRGGRSPARTLGYPVVLDELMPRVLHCCWEDGWAARLGGTAAVRLLVHKLPAEYLQLWSPQLARALLTVLKWLPDHSAVEMGEVEATLRALVLKCFNKEQIDAQRAARLAKEGKAAGQGAAGAGTTPAAGAAATDAKPMDVDAAPPAADGPSAPEAAAAAATSAAAAAATDSDAATADAAPQPTAAKPPLAPDGKPPLPPQAPQLPPEDAMVKVIAEVLLACILNPSSNERTRKAVQGCVELLAQEQNKTLYSWLKPILVNLHPSLPGRRLIPIKAVSYVIGQAQAFCFCLAQQRGHRDLFAVNAELHLFARDAQVMADRDEGQLYAKLAHGRGVTVEGIVKLRAECMNLLCGLMDWETFKESQDPDITKMREEIPTVFLRALMSSNTVIHTAAQACLKTVLLSYKLPKNLLQLSVRPVLANLGAYRSLSLNLLHGLARLLDLLSDWFNMTLGEKLIEHLKNWLDPDMLSKAAPFGWKPGEEVQVAAAILDCFHLLPKLAVKFLETTPTPPDKPAQPGLVVLTIQLEEKLSRTASPTPNARIMSSPYRAPLTRFLAKYPAESVAYFLDPMRMQYASYLSRFLDVLRSELGRPLLEELACGSDDKLLALLSVQPVAPAAGAAAAAGGAGQAGAAVAPAATEAAGAAAQPAANAPALAVNAAGVAAEDRAGATSAAAEGAAAGGVAEGSAENAAPGVGPEPAATAAFHAVHLVKALTELLPDWLPSRPHVYAALLDRWRSEARRARCRNEGALEQAQLLETKRLAQCLLHYIDKHLEEAPVLLEVASVYEISSCIDMGFVAHYINTTVSSTFSVAERSTIIQSWVNTFPSARSNELLQAALLSSVVLPVLEAAHKAGQADELLGQGLVDQLVKQVLVPTDEPTVQTGEQLRIKLVQLGTLLAQAIPARMQKAHRSTMQKWCWRLLLLPDESPCKPYAFVAMAHYMRPAKDGNDKAFMSAIMQVYASLLRHNQPEGKKGLLREALDELLPNMVQTSTPRSPSPAPGSPQRIPYWIKFTRKTLLEDGQSLMHLIQLWQLVVRHPDVFYPSKGVFVQQMVSSLSRMSMPPASPPENRRLALDLAALLLRWERQRREEAAARGEPIGGAATASASNAADAAAPGGGRKRSHDGATAPDTVMTDAPGAVEPAAKLQKTDGGTPAPGTAAPDPAAAAQGAAATASIPGTGLPPTGLPPTGLPAGAVPAPAPQHPLSVGVPSAGTTPGHSLPSSGAPSPMQRQPSASARPGDPEQLSPHNQDTLCNFLIRMAFLYGESQDAEAQALHSHALNLLDQLLALFPGLPIKLLYIERLLQAQASKDPMPALITGWQLLGRMLDHQPRTLPITTHQQFIQLLAPCFGLKHQHVVTAVCGVLRKLYAAHSLDDTAPKVEQALEIQKYINTQMNAYLAAGGDQQQPLLAQSQGQAPPPGPNGQQQPAPILYSPTPLLLGICTSLSILRAIEDVATSSYINSFIMLLVKMLNRCARELAQSGQQHQAAAQLFKRSVTQQPQPSDPSDPDPIPEPDYGTTSWIISQTLQLCASRAFHQQDSAIKKQMLQSLIVLLAGNGTKWTDPALFLRLLMLLEGWLQAPVPVLSVKEAGLLMQRMAMVELDRSVMGDSPVRARWQRHFFDLLYWLCSPANPNQELREEVFAKVERHSLVGLRAADPAIRAKFFALYDNLVARTLYDRLHYVIVGQDWVSMGQQFWLKQALDLIMAILKEGEPIMLAPNSAQIPPLLPGFRGNVYFSPGQEAARAAHAAALQERQQQQAAALQQQQQQQQQGTPQEGGVRQPGQQQGPGQAGPSGEGVLRADASGAAPTAEPAIKVEIKQEGVKQEDSLKQEPGFKQEEGPKAEAMDVDGQPAAQQAAAQQAAPAGAATAAPATTSQAASVSRADGIASTSAGEQPGAGPAAVGGSAPGPFAAAAAAGLPAGALASSGSLGQPILPTVNSALTPGLPPDPAAAPSGLARMATGVLPAMKQPQPPSNGTSSQELMPPPPPVPQPTTYNPPIEAMPITVRASEAPAAVNELINKHLSFLHETGTLKAKDLMGALSQYATIDPQVAYHLWVLVFPIVWATMEKPQQIQLAKPIIALLSKEYHQRQAHMRPNVVQALLEGISLSQPQPKIPPELIRFLGKTFNAWHIAISLLESHVIIFPSETRCFDALSELYKAIGEEDVMFGLWRRGCTVDMTRIALSLVQHSVWDKAEEVLGELNQAAVSNQLQVQPNRGEAALWLDQWINCCKQLNQWEPLHEYARGTDNNALTADSMWRLSDWDGLRMLTDPNNKTALDVSPQTSMIRAYGALQAGDLAPGEQHVTSAMQQALAKWWQLPDVGSMPQQLLLQLFQQLVELRESARVLADVSVSTREHSYSDVKDILETWRLRTPNDWDSMLHWQDVLMWRNNIYNIVIQAFSRMSEMAPLLHQMGYKDKAWSVNKLGSIAHKHGAPDVAIAIINNMYGYGAMEVQEAFVKIREQAKAYLDMPLDLNAGLNMLNTTNLDYFGQHHQAEIFRLKGLFLQELKESDQANAALSTSLMLWRQCPDTWTSWGQYCDTMFETETHRQQQQHQNAGQHGAAPVTPVATKWLHQAVHCYLQGMRLGNAKARDLLPRVLHLLSFDNDAHDGVVGRELSQSVANNELPLWLWFAWIPQLLTSLSRPEAAVVKPILKQLAHMYPQSLYCALRTFLLTLREGATRSVMEYERSKKVCEAALAAARVQAGEESDVVVAAKAALDDLRPGSDVSAFEAGKEVMEKLRSSHPMLGASLEAMMVEIGGKFVPKPEERLLAVVTALLHRCYKVPVANSCEVPSALRRELAGVCKACFSPDGGSRGRSVQLEMREAFVKDLNPEGPTFPVTLGELAERLKSWRNRLQTELEDKMPGVLRLEEECRALQDMNLNDIEMPGQYLAGHEVTPDSIVYLQHISSNVHIVRRHATSFRRLAFIGSDGRTRHMLVQTGQNSSQGMADDRMMQLLRGLNKLLDAHPESRRRCLSWHTPISVPVWPQVRLMEEEPSYCTYGEAYDINCARFGREPDMPIVQFKRKLAGPDGQYAPDPDYVLRHAAFTEITERVVSENIFSQYAYKTLPSGNHLWVFKKSLCSQMALSALLCHMLLLSGRSPNKILLAKDTGRVYQLDLMPLYGDRGTIERMEAVPFRLTRNLYTFFTAFGVEGVFTTAMVATAAALLAKGSVAPHLLSMFLKEDLLAWTNRRVSKSGAPAPAMKSEQLKGLVLYNVKKSLDRTKMCAPLKPGEDEMPQRTVHHGASELVAVATKPEALCRMDPTWMGWY